MMTPESLLSIILVLVGIIGALVAGHYVTVVWEVRKLRDELKALREELAVLRKEITTAALAAAAAATTAAQVAQQVAHKVLGKQNK